MPLTMCLVLPRRTRRGSEVGPFPTELFDDTGKHLSKRGDEFGATTGRARRCGWLDAVALRRMVELNGVDGLCVTKLDVLDGLDELKICTAYSSMARRLTPRRWIADDWGRIEPVYEVFPGWQEVFARRRPPWTGCPIMHATTSKPCRN